MKYLALLLLIATSARADNYERVVTRQSYQIQVDGVLIGKPSANRNLVLGAGYNEAKKCLTCKVSMISADATISARLVIASSSATSSAPSITLISNPPKFRENGMPLLVAEHGGYVLSVNGVKTDIPKTSGEPLVYQVNFPITKTDIITIAFYDKGGLTSDFVKVIF